MRYLTQELWRNRTVKHKVTIEQLHFLHRLPSPDGSRTGRRMGRLALHIWCQSMRIRSICIVRLQYGPVVVIVIVELLV